MSEAKTKFVLKNTFTEKYAEGPEGETYTEHLCDALLFDKRSVAKREIGIDEVVEEVLHIVVYKK